MCTCHIVLYRDMSGEMEEPVVIHNENAQQSDDEYHDAEEGEEMSALEGN